MRTALAFATAISVAACSEPSSSGGAFDASHLAHEAYVWQRAWNGEVSAAVAGAPTELTGLRVLALEISTSRAVWPAVDLGALARSRRPVTAVVRIDGSRPIASLSVRELVSRLDHWRAAGVTVAGIEIDHDCATARLPEYAGWLARARPPSPLRWSITALPTWAGSPALRDVAAAVDELVVQVHAVRAPRLFDPVEARGWLDSFAQQVDRPLRVALPTYRVVVGGRELVADPAQLARFVRDLASDPVPGVVGVVWFRLPVATDRAAWTASTLRAVIGGDAIVPRVRASLVARGGDRFDVVLANDGSADAAWPDLALRGRVAGADLIGGYRGQGNRWTAPRRTVRAGERVTVGWATGKEIGIDAM